MRSKDLDKARGLAVVFDHTAPTIYRASHEMVRPKRIYPFAFSQ